MSSRVNSEQWYKITKDIKTGRAIYVAKQHEAFFKALLRNHIGNYQLTELWRGIFSLNANAIKGHALNKSINTIPTFV